MMIIRKRNSKHLLHIKHDYLEFDLFSFLRINPVMDLTWKIENNLTAYSLFSTIKMENTLFFLFFFFFGKRGKYIF